MNLEFTEHSFKTWFREEMSGYLSSLAFVSISHTQKFIDVRRKFQHVCQVFWQGLCYAVLEFWPNLCVFEVCWQSVAIFRSQKNIPTFRRGTWNLPRDVKFILVNSYRRIARVIYDKHISGFYTVSCILNGFMHWIY